MKNKNPTANLIAGLKKEIGIDSEEVFNLAELRHLATNYVIAWMHGYRGSFDEWFAQISPQWRTIANQPPKIMKLPRPIKSK